MLGYHGDGYCRGDPTGRSYGGHLVVNVNKPLWIVVEEKVSCLVRSLGVVILLVCPTRIRPLDSSWSGQLSG